MTAFRYKSIAGDGKLVEGEMDAENARDVIAQLRAAGHMPISAAAKTERPDPGRVLRDVLAWRHRVRARDVTATFRELATLLNAGIPIDASLRMLERHARHARLKGVLARIHTDVQAGKPLSTALAAHPEVFDALAVSLTRAGEAAGALGPTLERIADYRERADRSRAAIVSALTYPAILLCVALVSLLVLMTFVIPRFIPLFADAGSTLPVLTTMVFATAEFFQATWWLAPLLLVFGHAGARRWMREADNRRRLHRWILHAPTVGGLVQAAETARFAGTLAALLRSGLPLLAALRLARDVLRNEACKDAVERSLVTVRAGGRLVTALGSGNAFPSLAVELIAVGEESGHLEPMLEKAADNFDAKVQESLKRMLTLLEPIVILGLGGLIGLVIVAVLMAMLSLNELVA